MLRAVDEVQFESLRMNEIGLESMYIQKQVNEFAAFQGSQGTRRAYLVETAEMGHNGRNDMGEWGLALGSPYAGSLVCLKYLYSFL
jgi:hypothetical protein